MSRDRLQQSSNLHGGAFDPEHRAPFAGSSASDRALNRRWIEFALRYGLAVVVVALATTLKWWLGRAYDVQPTFVTFYPAVLLAASIGGGGPGIVATVLAAIAADYWIIPPVGFGIETTGDAIALGIFTASGLCLSGLAERLRRTRWAKAVSVAQARELALVNLGNLIVRSLDDRIVRWSEGSQRLYGFAPQEALGRVSHELLQTRFPQPIEQIRGALLEQGRWEGDLIHHRKDGTEVNVASLWLLQRASDGQAPAILEVNNDITARKQAEKALHEGEERLRFALETSHAGAWDLDLVDRTAFRSLEHDRIFGYAELLPQWTYDMFLEHVLPADRAAVDARFRQATATNSNWNFECRIRRADGAVRWILAAGRHRMDAVGGKRQMAGIVQDVTERKQAEENIRQAAARFEILSETASALLQSTAPQKVVEALCQKVMEFLDCHIFRQLPGGRTGAALAPQRQCGHARQDRPGHRVAGFRASHLRPRGPGGPADRGGEHSGIL